MLFHWFQLVEGAILARLEIITLRIYKMAVELLNMIGELLKVLKKFLRSHT
jgi:hypothetical protein